MRLTRIDRYIFKQLWTPFAYGVLAFMFMLSMRVLFDLGELVIRQGAPPAIVFGLLLANLPRLMVMVLPAGGLLAVLQVYGRMGADSELVALRAAGVPLKRQARAALLFGGVLALGGLLLTHFGIPAGANYSRALADRIIQQSDPFRMIHAGEIFDRLPGLILHVQKIDPANRRFEGIFVHETRPDGGTQLSLASSGSLSIDKTNGRINLSLENGHTYEFPADNPLNLRETTFAVQQLGGQLPQSNRWAEREVAPDTVWQLPSGAVRRYTRGSSGADAALRRAARVEWLTRWSLPLAGLLLALLAVPLSLTSARGGRGAALGVALLTFAFYAIAQSMLVNFAKKGALSPWVAAFATPLLLAAWGGGLLRARTNRDDPGEGPLVRLWHRWLDARAARAASKEPPRAGEASYAEAGRASGRFAPRLLDGYIAGTVLRYVGYTLAAVVMMGVLVELRGVADDAAANGMPAWELGLLLASGVPELLLQVLPYAVLIGILVGFGALSRGSELVAMRAAGISIWRQGAPALLVAAFATFAMLLAGEFLVPASARTHWALVEKAKNKRLASGRYEDRSWIFGAAGGGVYNYHRDESPRPGETPTLTDFTFLRCDFERGVLLERITADRITITPEGPVAARGVARRRDGEAWRVETLADRPIALPDSTSYLVPKQRSRAETMSARELIEYARVLEEKKLRGAVKVRISLHGKFADAFSCVVMAVLGLAFAFRAGRGGSLLGIGVGLGLGICFVMIDLLLNNLGQIGLQPAPLAGWGACGLALLAGLWWYAGESS